MSALRSGVFDVLLDVLGFLVEDSQQIDELVLFIYCYVS